MKYGDKETERDPRIDPQAGDVVEVSLDEGEIETREVHRVVKHASEWEVYCFIDGHRERERCYRMKTWRAYADDSTVLKRGDAR